MGLLLLVLAAALAFASNARAASPVPLGTAEPFAVLAGSTVTNTGPTVLNGDLGLSPGTSVTGFPPGTVNGSQHVTDAVASQAQTDLTTAYNDAAAQAPTGTVSADLGGQRLAPGVYRSASSLGLTGALTLDAQGNANAVFIFQAGSTLTTASASSVNLVNGAQACNVFWQVGSSATLGTASSFRGSILALTSITATTGATVDGRVLARNAAVTLDTNTITRSRCATPTPGADRTAPRVRVTTPGAPRRCVSRGFTARVRVSDASGLRRVDVFLDGRRIKRTTRTRFSVPIKAGQLRAARHRIRVVATDRVGNRRTVTRSFARCAAAIPRFTG
ncbi:MAG: ice-binding family protein [Actinomycetota bacterium]|nr:ice-binding family protein [Actinomycetota bacterium]